MTYQPKPVEWFIARIGQRIFRDQQKHCCAHCDETEKNGFEITDKMHAEYLALVDTEYANLGIFMNYRDEK